MDKEKRNIITLELPKDLSVWLKKLANTNERSLSAQIRLILKQFKENNEK